MDSGFLVLQLLKKDFWSAESASYDKLSAD